MNSKTYYTQLRLDPLGKESADEMLTALLGDGNDLLPLRRLIIERTEGNPFFMEEIVQVLFDEGALVRDGRLVKPTKPLDALKIPPTVQGILAARMDRLPANTKELLQALAVIGREFPVSLIRAVLARSDDELNRLLNDLQLGEFIYEQPAVGDTEYIFKHALTQEVAYNSVLIERRQQLHGRTAAALETLYKTSPRGTSGGTRASLRAQRQSRQSGGVSDARRPAGCESLGLRRGADAIARGSRVGQETAGSA